MTQGVNEYRLSIYANKDVAAFPVEMDIETEVNTLRKQFEDFAYAIADRAQQEGQTDLHAEAAALAEALEEIAL